MAIATEAHGSVNSGNLNQKPVIPAPNCYCPKAIIECSVNKSRRNPSLFAAVRSHIQYLGWEIQFLKSKGIYHYISPDGKLYHSLRQVCHDLINSGTVSSKKPSSSPPPASTNPEQVSVQPLTQSHDISQSRKKKRKDNQTITQDQNPNKPTCVMQTSKRARHEIDIPTSAKRNPRTVISWLIDNNVVLPMAKVYYRGKGDTISATGQISHDGIKCDCCNEVFNISAFEVHAGSKRKRPAPNIFLVEDGRSLLDCQNQILSDANKVRSSTTRKQESANGTKSHCIQDRNDHICSICQYGGDLILCDDCPSSFHQSCIGLNDIPDGDWFCPPCSCRICGDRKFEVKTENSMDDDTVRVCDQCEHKFHMGCVRKSVVVKLKNHNKWFCSDRCGNLYSSLHELLKKPFPLGVDNLTWTVLKSMENEHPDDSFETETETETEARMENQSKLNVAVEVMHECFERVSLTGRDLVEDVIFNRRSNLKRLNFHGFYTVLLERNEEIITAANFRVYDKVAEIPLVATRLQYRRHGMCRLLMNELEKKLAEIGVERLILPAVSDVLNTWTTKFGFSKMTAIQKLQYLGYGFLDFQDATMCQKLLMKTPSGVGVDNSNITA